MRTNGPFAPADNDLRMEPELTQGFDRMLRGFCLEIAHCILGDECYVQEDVIVFRQVPSHLTDGFQERHALYVTNSPADLDKTDIGLRPIGEFLFCCLAYAGLDLVRNMGNNLDCLAKEIATALLFDDGAVHLAGRDIMGCSEFNIKEPLIIAKVKVNLAAVLEHKHFTVLCRVHCPRIDIQVRIDLHCRHPVAPVLQDAPDGGRGYSFPQTAHHPPGNNDVLHVISPTALHFAHSTY